MAKKFPFALVDAFTTVPLGGNPCAVIFAADSLSDAEMLALAREMNQSETAFVLKSREYDLKARYFTPEKEIPLAGHPTIATIFACIDAGVIDGNRDSFQLELNEGPIAVEIRSHGDRPLIKMFQRKPVFSEIHDPSIVMPIFGLRPDDVMPNAPIQTVSTGTRQLMIPVKSQEALKRMALDIDRYKSYREKMNFFSPHLFCLQGISADATTFARHPGLQPTEDPFTGSSTGGMAAHLWHHGLLETPTFIAEQGHWMGRPGRAFVEVIGDRKNIETVVVAGQAVSLIKGELSL